MPVHLFEPWQMSFLIASMAFVLLGLLDANNSSSGLHYHTRNKPMSFNDKIFSNETSCKPSKELYLTTASSGIHPQNHFPNLFPFWGSKGLPLLLLLHHLKFITILLNHYAWFTMSAYLVSIIRVNLVRMPGLNPLRNFWAFVSSAIIWGANLENSVNLASYSATVLPA